MCSQDEGQRLGYDLPNLKTDYNFDMEALHVLHKANPTLSLQPSGSPGEMAHAKQYRFTRPFTMVWVEGKLVIGVLTDPGALQDMDMAVFTTWVRDIESKNINVRPP